MLVLIGFWALLAVSAFAVGHALLTASRASAAMRAGDRNLLALWLGLIALEWLCLSLALVSPVTAGRAAMLIAPLTVVAFLIARREIVAHFRGLLRGDVLVAGTILLLAGGFAAASLRTTPDIGEYHYPAIRWLADYGIVTGVAHVMTRLGYVSGIFALTTPFDALAPGRALAAVNGLILCLVAAQIVIAAARIFTTTARGSDWFLLTASAAILALALIIGNVTTSTPDFQVMALTAVCGWRMLAEQNESGGGGRRTMLPMLLAGGALIAKTSGILLVPFAALFAVAGKPLRSWVLTAVAGAVLVAPFFAAAVKASGCLALPSPASCLPLPWTLPAETVRALADNLWAWSRWGGPLPAGAGSWDWLPHWLAGRPFWFNAAIFWCFLVTSIAYLALAARRLSAGERWVLTLIVPSIALVLINAPDLRFNFGVFVAPGALLAMHGAQRFGWAEGGSLPVRGAIVAALAVAMVQVAYTVVIDRAHGRGVTVERLILPREAPQIAVTPRRTGDVAYVTPASGAECWRATPPCADHVLGGIALRDPARGVGGGFIAQR